MKVVVSRVARASVEVGGGVVGGIGKGLFLLVGVAAGDEVSDVELLASKCAALRIFDDGQGKMNLDMKAVGGAALAVPNFTLSGDCRSGNRPSFIGAEAPGRASQLFDLFVALLKEKGIPVETGLFGADMRIESVADGPITLVLDSRELSAR